MSLEQLFQRLVFRDDWLEGMESYYIYPYSFS